jgi:hypothetical protein
VFEGLNWFEHMHAKFDKDKKGIQQRLERLGQNMTNEDDQLEDQMSMNRLENLDKEFRLLNYSFSASLILFKEI